MSANRKCGQQGLGRTQLLWSCVAATLQTTVTHRSKTFSALKEQYQNNLVEQESTFAEVIVGAC